MRCACEHCNGSGMIPCYNCDGEGSITPNLDTLKVRDHEAKQVLAQARTVHRQCDELCAMMPHNSDRYKREAGEIINVLIRKAIELDTSQ